MSDTPNCFSSHMGIWLMHPARLMAAVGLAKSGTLPEAEPVKMGAYTMEAAARIVTTNAGGIYAVHPNGMATVSIQGSITKGASKFGGTSSVAARQAVRAAAADNDVRGIMLHVDSPGGHVAGVDELATAIAAATSVKPVHAYVEDLGASAALWAASQADVVSVNRAGEVGSIGVVAVLHDTSGLYEREGIKVHVVSTGPMKGAGAEGTPITEEIVESVQARVDDINKLFIQAIADGRDMDVEAVEKIATGEVFGADQAKKLGLVDSVSTIERAVATLEAAMEASYKDKRKATTIRRMSAELDMLDLD